METVDEILRNDHVAEPQRWKQHLAEASGEQNDSVLVETLEDGDRAAGVAVFTVVVVLEDQGSRSAGPFEQGEPSWQTHRHSQWGLVGRRRVGETGSAMAGTGKIHAFLVDGEGDDLRPHRVEDPGCAEVARIFHEDAVAWAEEETGGEVQRLLD